MPMTSVRMPDELCQRLDNLGEQEQRSRGWLIKDAVSEYLERKERKARMLKETREAMKDVEAGRLLDGGEVMAWVESWGSDNELEPPKV